jgi:hypothetical protein
MAMDHVWSSDGVNLIPPVESVRRGSVPVRITCHTREFVMQQWSLRRDPDLEARLVAKYAALVAALE